MTERLVSAVLLELLNQFQDSPAKALANTLKSWIDPVMRMWRFS